MPRELALTFRADAHFVTQVDDLARIQGVSRSDYVRQAVEEKNARAMADRVAFLSKALGERHAKFNNDLDGSTGDGLGV